MYCKAKHAASVLGLLGPVFDEPIWPQVVTAPAQPQPPSAAPVSRRHPASASDHMQQPAARDISHSAVPAAGTAADTTPVEAAVKDQPEPPVSRPTVGPALSAGFAHRQASPGNQNGTGTLEDAAAAHVDAEQPAAASPSGRVIGPAMPPSQPLEPEISGPAIGAQGPPSRPVNGPAMPREEDTASMAAQPPAAVAPPRRVVGPMAPPPEVLAAAAAAAAAYGDGPIPGISGQESDDDVLGPMPDELALEIEAAGDNERELEVGRCCCCCWRVKAWSILSEASPTQLAVPLHTVADRQGSVWRSCRKTPAGL